MDEAPLLVPGLLSQTPTGHYFAAESPKMVVEDYVSRLESERPGVPFFSEEVSPPIASEIDIRTDPTQALFWEDVQDIVLTVLAAPPHRRLFEEAL